VLASFLGKRAECTRFQKRAGSLFGNASAFLFGLSEAADEVTSDVRCSLEEDVKFLEALLQC
jgi:hypothetical protein